jgi:hypothetical protein
MDRISSITADRFRGNIYSKLGFYQKNNTLPSNTKYFKKSLIAHTQQTYKSLKIFNKYNKLNLIDF